MKVNSRTYKEELGFNKDYNDIHVFLKKMGSKGYYENWHWGRWEWLIGHTLIKQETLPLIGIWHIKNKVVAIVTHDMRLGEAYIIFDPTYRQFLGKMILHAEKHLSIYGKLEIILNSNDYFTGEILNNYGYTKIDSKETVLKLNCITEPFKYNIPEGYRIKSFADDRNIQKYERVLWKGFNHEGEPPYMDNKDYRNHPHFNPYITVFIEAPGGEYASHCGMWYDSNDDIAYIEPVVTIPECRKLGLGKAVIYESINRCRELGAKSAIVISNQEFYRRIGFQTSSEYIVWEKSLI